MFIVLGAINVLTSAVLLSAAWKHRWPALVDRAIVSLSLTVAGACIAVLAIGRLMRFNFDRTTGTALLLVPLILLSVPGVVWLIAYHLGRFDEPA